MWPWLPVLGQALLAAAGLHCVCRGVYPGQARSAGRGLIVDVWGPVVVILPLLFLASRGFQSVDGVGWLPIGGPVVALVAATGVALLRLPRPTRAMPADVGPARRAGLVWTAAGVLLLLLGAAHELSMAIGQTAFAAGAVLLWLNTPPPESLAQSSPDDRGDRTGAWMLLALVLAVAQGLVVRQVSAPWLPVSGLVLFAYVLVAVGAAGWSLGLDATLRLGGWTATLGLLLGLGVMSLAHLTPAVLSLVRGGVLEDPEPVRRVAYGFGRLVPEGVALAVLGAFAGVGVRDRIAAHRWIGAAALAVAAALAAARLLAWW